MITVKENDRMRRVVESVVHLAEHRAVGVVLAWLCPLLGTSNLVGEPGSKTLRNRVLGSVEKLGKTLQNG